MFARAGLGDKNKASLRTDSDSSAEKKEIRHGSEEDIIAEPFSENWLAHGVSKAKRISECHPERIRYVRDEKFFISLSEAQRQKKNVSNAFALAERDAESVS